ncbi:PaaI family thioesterase [Variovorax paradoxus]|uniref:PaaI family thioesterase n=1 Tax=Variovorax paradoxus TaxID=34073 RepID=UPI001ABBF4BA
MVRETIDPADAQRVRASFERQNAMRELGIELVEVRAGEVELAMPASERLTQQHGFLHAGIVATGLDSACGYAAFSLMPPEAAVLTVEFKINLLAPAAGERFVFRAGVTKAGRTISVSDGRAYALREGKESLIATMTATLMAVVGRDDIRH